MNIIKFRRNIMRLLCSTEGEEAFHALRMKTDGLSSPKAAKIINYACKCCGPDELYVEVGTYSGFTLCAAGYQTLLQCIGIDNLSLKDVILSDEKVSSEEELRDKIRKRIFNNIYGIRGSRMHFVEKDFRNVMDFNFNGESKKVSVAYLDGDHTYKGTKEAFDWIRPKLADDSILIVDDLHIMDVLRPFMEELNNGLFMPILIAISGLEDLDVTMDEGISTGLGILWYNSAGVFKEIKVMNNSGENNA